MLPETRKERDSVFAPREIAQIIIAWIVLSLAISLSYVGGLPQGTSDYLEIIAAFIATATGFILHEMGHKFEAMRLGYTAHFRIWAVGIALTLVTAVLTRGAFLFGAPGAVYIAPAAGMGALGYTMTRQRNEDRDNMLISAAGPGVNLALAVFFLLLLLVSPGTGFVTTVATYGFGLNVGLGSFNMLPIPPIDGYKIFKNNIGVALAIALPLWGLFAYFILGL
jgi:Zn-dependent protease